VKEFFYSIGSFLVCTNWNWTISRHTHYLSQMYKRLQHILWLVLFHPSNIQEH